jgi:hypothetical protein
MLTNPSRVLTILKENPYSTDPPHGHCDRKTAEARKIRVVGKGIYRDIHCLTVYHVAYADTKVIGVFV